MKIVYVVRKFLENFAYQDRELADIHTRMGYDVTIITGESDNSSLYFDMSKVTNDGKDNKSEYKVIRLPLMYNVNFRFWRFRNLLQTLEEISPDIIFLHGAPMFCLPDMAKYKKEHPSVFFAMDCHNDYNNAAHGFLSRVIMHKLIYRTLIRNAMNEVDMFYYLAPNIRVFMKDMYRIPEEKLHFLPRGCILDNINLGDEAAIRQRIRKELCIPEDATIIVSGGKLDEKKKSHDLCRAVNELGIPDVHLILFGFVDNSYRQLLEDAIGGNCNIHLTGWIKAEEVYDYFLASDIGCFPGGHSVMWEQAICCGLPLIVKDWYNGMHYLNVNNNVLFIKDSDVHYIKEALSELIHNKRLRKEMRTNALNEGRRYFSYKRIAQIILDDATLVTQDNRGI